MEERQKPLPNEIHTLKASTFQCKSMSMLHCCCIPFVSYLSPFFCFDLTLRLLVLFYFGSLLREALKSINDN